MRRIGVLAILLLTTGCVSVIDTDEIPAASADLSAQVDACLAETTPHPAGLECVIAADKAFVTRIHLTQMSIFEAYAARMRLLASDIDSGRETDQARARERYTTIRRDLFQGIEAAYQADESRRARIAAGFSAMGAGLQQAGASYNAGVPPSPPPQVVCTTTPARLNGSGGSTTICH